MRLLHLTVPVLILCGGASAAEVKVLQPIADATIRYSTPDEAQQRSRLWVRGVYGDARKALVVFDLEALGEEWRDAEVDSATVQFTRSGGEGGGFVIGVYASLDGMGWDGVEPGPENLSWRNAPKNSLEARLEWPAEEQGNILLEEVTLGSSRDDIVIDVLPLVRWLQGKNPDFGLGSDPAAQNGKLSLMLAGLRDFENSNAWHFFGSESEGTPAELVLEISGGAGS